MSNTRKKEITEPSFKDSITAYFKGVRSEWGKVTWPERKQTLYQTIVVIGVVIFFTILVLVADIVLCFILHPTDICRSCLHPTNKSLCK